MLERLYEAVTPNSAFRFGDIADARIEAQQLEVHKRNRIVARNTSALTLLLVGGALSLRYSGAQDGCDPGTYSVSRTHPAFGPEPYNFCIRDDYRFLDRMPSGLVTVNAGARVNTPLELHLFVEGDYNMIDTLAARARAISARPGIDLFRYLSVASAVIREKFTEVGINTTAIKDTILGGTTMPLRTTPQFLMEKYPHLQNEILQAFKNNQMKVVEMQGEGDTKYFELEGGAVAQTVINERNPSEKNIIAAILVPQRDHNPNAGLYGLNEEYFVIDQLQESEDEEGNTITTLVVGFARWDCINPLVLIFRIMHQQPAAPAEAPAPTNVPAVRLEGPAPVSQPGQPVVVVQPSATPGAEVTATPQEISATPTAENTATPQGVPPTAVRENTATPQTNPATSVATSVAAPTSAPSTSAPATSAPATSAPATSAPATAVPPVPTAGREPTRAPRAMFDLDVTGIA